MSKLVKLEMLRKTIMLLIVIILIGTFSAILLVLLWKIQQPKIYSSLYTAREPWKYPCLSKGSVCSKEEIKNAIKVKLNVNENKEYNFYLISNDENTATFILDRNIYGTVNWNTSIVNYDGPFSVLYSLARTTKDWKYIPLISDYKYEDEGYKTYQEICNDSKEYLKDVSYDCSEKVYFARGYKSITIKDGKATIESSVREIDDPDSYHKYTYEQKFRARLIEEREIENLIQKDYKLPDWLIDNLPNLYGYWSMTSSTLPATDYVKGAHGIININNEANKKLLYVLNNENDLYRNNGIRPVITLDKEYLETNYNRYTYEN